MTFSSALAVSELASMKKLLFRLLYVTGITTFAAWWNRKRLAILCYHGVTERPGQSPEDAKGLHVNRTRFERHLNFLQSKYNLISLQEYLIARETRERLPKYSAVLTFDDGFRNFLTVAAPLLVKRRIPAIIYLITDNAANGNGARNAEWTPEDDRTYLSWSEARMLKEKYGFEFGSHTCSHSRLLGLPSAETDRELLHSLNDLVSQLRVERPSLSYPKGEYSSFLANRARKSGYASAVTTDRVANEFDRDLFTLGRSLIGNYDDESSLAVRVSGLRWWLIKALGAVGVKLHSQPLTNESEGQLRIPDVQSVTLAPTIKE